MMISPEKVLKTTKKTSDKKIARSLIQYEFSWCDDEMAPNPHCIVCGERSLNESMVTSK